MQAEGLGPCLAQSGLHTWSGSRSSLAPALPDSSQPTPEPCFVASRHLPSTQLKLVFGVFAGEHRQGEWVGVSRDGRFLSADPY